MQEKESGELAPQNTPRTHYSWVGWWGQEGTSSCSTTRSSSPSSKTTHSGSLLEIMRYLYIIQVQKPLNMDVGMHHAKNRGNKEIPLAILSRILAQSCVTLCLNYVGRVTHDCASILDSIAKDDFSHGASLHPYSCS